MTREYDRLEILLGDLRARYSINDETVLAIQDTLKKKTVAPQACTQWPRPQRPSMVPTRYYRMHLETRTSDY